MTGKIMAGVSFLIQIILALVFCFSEISFPQVGYVVLWVLSLLPGVIGLQIS